MSRVLSGGVRHMRSLGLAAIILLLTATFAAMACEGRIIGRIQPDPSAQGYIKIAEDVPKGAKHTIFSIGIPGPLDDGREAIFQRWSSTGIEIAQQKIPDRIRFAFLI